MQLKKQVIRDFGAAGFIGNLIIGSSNAQVGSSSAAMTSANILASYSARAQRIYLNGGTEKGGAYHGSNLDLATRKAPKQKNRHL